MTKFYFRGFEMKKSLFTLAFIACFAFADLDGLKFAEAEEKKCEGGDMDACYVAGLSYIDNGNPDKGVDILKKACDRGGDLACNDVIVKIIDEDPKEGIKFAERKCSEGSGKSCLNLGMLYHTGKFVEKNIKEAINYYDKACNAKIGDAISCEVLMTMYDDGKDVKMDKLKAAVYMKKGCDLGDCVACYNFANFNYYTMKDKSKAAQYYKKACDISKDHIIFRESEIYEKSCDMYELLK